MPFSTDVRLPRAAVPVCTARRPRVVSGPPPSDLMVGDGHVDYEFASADYARRFADANPGAELER